MTDKPQQQPLAKISGDIDLSREMLREFREYRAGHQLEHRELFERISAIHVTLARLEARDEEHKRDNKRFWSESWPRVERLLDDHETRLKTLERLEVSNLSERIAALETWKAKAIGAIAAATVFASAGTALMIKIVGG